MTTPREDTNAQQSAELSAKQSAELSAQLRRGSLLLIAIAGGGFAADYALNVGLTRLLSPHEYGDYRVAQAFATFLGVWVLLGGDRSTPGAIAGALERGERGVAWEYLRFFLRLGLGLSALAIAGTWAASALHLGSTDAEHHHALAWLVLSVPLVALGGLFSRALLSGQHPALAALPWRIGFPVAKLAALGLVSLAFGGVSLRQVLWIAIGVVGAICAFQWWQLRRLVLPTLERAPASRLPRRWLAQSLPMMGTFLITLALNQSDLYLLEALSREHHVGHYAAAATTAHFLTIIQATIVTMVAPHLHVALDRGDEPSRAVFWQGQRLMLVALLPAGLALSLGAGPILRIFGPTYGDARLELILLTWAAFAWAITALAALWLQSTGRAGQLLTLTGVTLAIDLALDWLLIPRWGMLGAAGSTAFTLTLAAIAIGLLARRDLSTPPPSTPPSPPLPTAASAET